MQVSFAPFDPHESPSLLTIYINGVFWRHIHPSIFGKHKPNLPQACKNLTEYEEQFAIMEYRLAKNYALRRLSLQPMLSNLLAKTLKEKLVSPQIIQDVIQELKEAGFINDQEWSESFVRMQKNKKFGPRVIAQKLLNKGVEKEALENVLANLSYPQEVEETIQNLLKTRYAKRSLSDFKERQKVIASLARRGFAVSNILNVIDSLINK